MHAVFAIFNRQHILDIYYTFTWHSQYKSVYETTSFWFLFQLLLLLGFSFFFLVSFATVINTLLHMWLVDFVQMYSSLTSNYFSKSTTAQSVYMPMWKGHQSQIVNHSVKIGVELRLPECIESHSNGLPRISQDHICKSSWESFVYQMKTIVEIIFHIRAKWPNKNKEEADRREMKRSHQTHTNWFPLLY